MASLQYEILKKQSSTMYLYLIEDKQLFTMKIKTNRGAVFRCKNRKCHNTVQIIDDICTRKEHNAHHFEDKGEEEYIETKLEIALKDILLQNLYKKKRITEILSENGLPTTTKLKYKLHRLKKKLTPKKMKNASKIRQKSINKVNSTKENNENNDLWTCSIIPKNQKENKSSTLESELSSTNTVLQSAWNTLYPANDLNQYSDSRSVSSHVSTQSASTSDSSDINNVNNLNSGDSCSEGFDLNDSLAKFQIEAIFVKNHKRIDNHNI